MQQIFGLVLDVVLETFSLSYLQYKIEASCPLHTKFTSTGMRA